MPDASVLHLRQICLVARHLTPVLDDLRRIFGLETCHIDPAVEAFGLENALLAAGNDFLEVVAPIREGTAAGRYLDRRGGDGGYMVICQALGMENQRAFRQRALQQGVRIAHEAERERYHLCQLHPRDMQAAFLEIDWDAEDDPAGHWAPAGGLVWQETGRTAATHRLSGVRLQGPDPQALAEHWSGVTGLPLDADGSLRLANATIRFEQDLDGRGPGLAAIDLALADMEGAIARAQEHDCLHEQGHLLLGGVRWHLHPLA